jgi:hypothetical protein
MKLDNNESRPLPPAKRINVIRKCRMSREQFFLSLAVKSSTVARRVTSPRFQ